MKFYDKITGNDIRRAYQEFDVRSDKLPLDYQIAWKEIKVVCGTIRIFPVGT